MFLRRDSWKWVWISALFSAHNAYFLIATPGLVHLIMRMLDLIPEWLSFWVIYTRWINPSYSFGSTPSFRDKVNIEDCAWFHFVSVAFICFTPLLWLFSCWLVVQAIKLFHLARLRWQLAVSSNSRTEAGFTKEQDQVMALLSSATGLNPDLCWIVVAYRGKKSLFLDSRLKLFRGDLDFLRFYHDMTRIRIASSSQHYNDMIVIDFETGPSMSKPFDQVTPARVERVFPNLLVVYIDDIPRVLPIKSAVWDHGLAFWCRYYDKEDEILILGQPGHMVNWVSTRRWSDVSFGWEFEPQ